MLLPLLLASARGATSDGSQSCSEALQPDTLSVSRAHMQAGSPWKVLDAFRRPCCTTGGKQLAIRGACTLKRARKRTKTMTTFLSR
jgi:hypothetical protein